MHVKPNEAALALVLASTGNLFYSNVYPVPAHTPASRGREEDKNEGGDHIEENPWEKSMPLSFNKP